MLSWICSLFFLSFPSILGWNKSHGIYVVFFHLQVFLRAARWERRDKTGQILSVLWCWPKSNLPGSSIWITNTGPSVGAVKGENYTRAWWTTTMSVTFPQCHTTWHMCLQYSIWHMYSSRWNPAAGPVVSFWVIWATWMAQGGLKPGLWV